MTYLGVMPVVLKAHPGTPAEALVRLEAEAERFGAQTLALRFILTGALSDLILPAAAAPRRADGLWNHTCFEAFVRSPGDPSYHEFNFAPSTQWAAYRFEGYRSGMSEAPVTPRIAVHEEPGRFTLEAEVELGLAPDAAWELAVSAVIEETNGRKSYWALAHPAGKPDFHHPDSFTLQLPAAA